MLKKLRQHLAADLQRFMKRLHEGGVGRGLGPAERNPHQTFSGGELCATYYLPSASWRLRLEPLP